jgi:hypothetical protein
MIIIPSRLPKTFSADIILLDDIDLALGTGSDGLLRLSSANAHASSSNEDIVLALSDNDQALHITDKAAVGTDWDLADVTHPTLYIHSNTTPATDYLLIGGHTGTVATIDVVGGTTLSVDISGTAMVDFTASTMAFQQATTVSTSTGNLTVSAAAGADVLIGDDATILRLDGGAFGGVGGIGIFTTVPAWAQIQIDSPAVNAAADNDFYRMYFRNISGPVTVPSGTAPLVVTLRINEPNITATGTVSEAITLDVTGAPTEGTENYAVRVDSGKVRIDDQILLGITDSSPTVSAAGSMIAAGGVAIGADALNNLIDNASGGSGSTAIYIGNQQITTSSDVRLKCNIEDFQGDALGILQRARVVEFGWDDPGDQNPWGKDSRGRYVGLLAQEQIAWAPWTINPGSGRDCPKCLTGEECGDHGMWNTEYQHLVPLVVRGIQDLDKRIAELEAKKQRL